jgi:hypothetical protein
MNTTKDVSVHHWILSEFIGLSKHGLVGSSEFIGLVNGD